MAEAIVHVICILDPIGYTLLIFQARLSHVINILDFYLISMR